MEPPPRSSAIRFLNKKLDRHPVRLCVEGNRAGEAQGKERVLGSCLLYISQRGSVPRVHRRRPGQLTEALQCGERHCSLLGKAPASRGLGETRRVTVSALQSSYKPGSGRIRIWRQVSGDPKRCGKATGVLWSLLSSSSYPRGSHMRGEPCTAEHTATCFNWAEANLS